MSPNISRSYEKWLDGSRGRFGSLADIAAALPNVRFKRTSGLMSTRPNKSSILDAACSMSALRPKADVIEDSRHVRFVPKGDIPSRHSRAITADKTGPSVGGRKV